MESSLAPVALPRRQYLPEPSLDGLARDRAGIHQTHDSLSVDEHGGRDAAQRVTLAHLASLVEFHTPFPVLLDQSGKVRKSYALRGRPTCGLIDVPVILRLENAGTVNGRT